MEIKIFDTQGKMVAERHYLPAGKKAHSKFLLSENEPGVYIVNVIIDDVVKTRKVTFK